MELNRITYIGIVIYIIATIILAYCTYYQIFIYEPPIRELPYYMNQNFSWIPYRNFSFNENFTR